MYLALWTLMASPPNKLVALQCRVVRVVTIFFLSVVIPLLQQGVLCNGKGCFCLVLSACLP